jgi:hypothetical protein
LSLLRKPYAKYKRTRVAEAFCDIVGYDPTFDDLKTPFSTFGVDLISQKIHVYSADATPKMRVSHALRISTALPFLFPLQSSGEHLLMDGAVVSQSPIWLATAYNDQLPILVLRPRKDAAAPPPGGPMEYLARLIDLGGGSRDDYLIARMPRTWLIEIDWNGIRFDQFDLPADVRASLIACGRAAVDGDLKKGLLGFVRAGSRTPSDSDAGRPDEGIEERSVQSGTAAINSLLGAMSVRRDQVFISYSHQDTAWLHKFQDALKPYIRNRAIRLWDDTQIPPGAVWNQEIKEAMAATKVAVLLVTRDYLASDFVSDEELPEFIRASEHGLKVLWVAVGPSGYKQTPLERLQCVTQDPDNAPLSAMTPADQDKELVRVCEEIAKALNS